MALGALRVETVGDSGGDVDRRFREPRLRPPAARSCEESTWLEMARCFTASAPCRRVCRGHGRRPDDVSAAAYLWLVLHAWILDGIGWIWIKWNRIGLDWISETNC